MLKKKNTKGAVPEPSLTTIDQTADRALLQCSVKGAFPKPTVEWKNSAGEVLPSVVTHESEVNDRFDITHQTNVTQNGRYSCVVTQDDISHQVSSETFVRLGPVKVKVKEGDDVVLRCSLGQTDLTNQVFEWKKDGQEVFYYNASTGGGRGGQDPQFKGRVSHFEDELTHGNASIKIRDTKWEDRGDYSCEFPNLQNQIFPIELAVDPDFEKRNIEAPDSGSEFPGWLIPVLLAIGVLIGVVIGGVIGRGTGGVIGGAIVVAALWILAFFRKHFCGGSARSKAVSKGDDEDVPLPTNGSSDNRAVVKEESDAVHVL